MTGMVLLLEHLRNRRLLLRIILCYGIEKHPAEAAQLAQAMHLVEDCYGVDHAPFCLLSWWEVVILPFIYEYEAATVLLRVSNMYF